MSMIGNLIARFGTYALDYRSGNAGRYRAAKEVAATMQLSREELTGLQLERLRAIVDYAYTNSPWYKTKFDAVGFKPGDLKRFEDIRALPILTKEDIRDNIKQLLSVAVDPSQRVFSRSGGTTGTPMEFCRSLNSQVYRRGIDLAIQRYYGWKVGDWQGALWGAPRDLTLNPSLKDRVKARMFDHAFSVNSWRLNDESYETFVRLARKYRPTFITAYPSIAYDLAERIESGHVGGVRVPTVSVTAEPFYEYQREKIENTFAENAYSRYGAREFGTVAFECPRKDGLHLVMESVYLEAVLDDSLEGDVGNILVTDLINDAMPLIRYQVGDLGALEPETSTCDCGLQTRRIRNIEGRDTDILRRLDGSGIAGFNMVTVVAASGINTRVQFLQRRPDLIVVRVEGKPEDHAEAIARIIGALKEQIGSDLSYPVEGVNQIERTSSGKYRYVVSELPGPGSEGRQNDGR